MTRATSYPAGILLESQELPEYRRFKQTLPSRLSAHCASAFGIVEIVAGLAKAEGCDTNQEGWMGYTPLGWAACYGHEEVVEMLLERDEINPNKPNDASAKHRPGVLSGIGTREW